MDVSITLEMTICVVNQLKNDSYRQGLYVALSQLSVLVWCTTQGNDCACAAATSGGAAAAAALVMVVAMLTA